MHGYVCGGELAARRPTDARRPVDPAGCAVALRIENLDTRSRHFGGHGSIHGLADMIWLRVADGRGEVVALETIDIRPTPDAQPVPSAELGPGSPALLLLGGVDHHLTRPGERPDELTLLRGRVVFGDEFTLRTELVPDPPTAKPTTPKRRKKNEPTED